MAQLGIDIGHLPTIQLHKRFHPELKYVPELLALRLQFRAQVGQLQLPRARFASRVGSYTRRFQFGLVPNHFFKLLNQLLLLLQLSFLLFDEFLLF